VGDPEDEDDLVLIDDVVHDAMIADSQSVEGVARSLDGLDGLATESPGRGDIECELDQCVADPRSRLGREVLERPAGRGREFDLVGAQSRSPKLIDRPMR
jgi:hypothetical protein